MYKLLLIVALILTESAIAQRITQNWPVTVALQFHNVSMPFRDLKTTLSNVGISLGTEFSYNRQGTLNQNVQISYYRNRYAGDGLMAQAQLIYRPHVGSAFGEIKAGLGWLYNFTPTQTLTLREGQWQTQLHTGKSMLLIPLGVSLGYENRQHPARLSPFVSYQFGVALGYNPSIPLVPNQFLQVGSRIHLH